MNNDGYASIRNTQKNYFNERYVGTGPETGLKLPDLKGLALVYNFHYFKIDDVFKLDEQLAKIMDSERPIIVDIRLVRDEALTPKVSALPQKDGSILSMPLEDMMPLLPLDVLRKEMISGLSNVSEKVRNNDPVCDV